MTNANDGGEQPANIHSNSSVQSQRTLSSDPVEHLRNLLGRDVVLLPIPTGTKSPVHSGWQKIDVSEMENPEYLQRLRQEGNTGVLLGEASGGLCAIDIDDDDQVGPFLDLNPGLRHTLRTKGARGEQIWIRPTSPYPKLTKLTTEAGNAWGEWRADGGQSVIRGTHPSGRGYRFISEASPVSTRYEDINWPENVRFPTLKTDFDILVENAGEPLTISENGSVGINQKFFVQQYMQENCVVYDSSLGDFYKYEQDLGLWKVTTTDTIKRQFLDQIGRIASQTGFQRLHNRCTENMAASLTGLLRISVESPDVFSKRPPAIHVKNGMICFEGDEVLLRSFHPDFYSRNICPYEFDPSAQCPQFLNELLGPALNADDIRLVQKWAGAILLGKNDAQRLLMLLGTPGGGKSTLMTVLEGVIGPSNVAQLRTEHLGKPFELYAFNGKTLLTGKDVAADFMSLRSASTIKSLIGGDLLEAEKKGHNNRVQIRGDYNVGITCNADLNIRLEGDVGAWRRRLMVVKYDRPPATRRVVAFADKLLQEEGSGILKWMVDGAIRLLEDLRGHGDYQLTEEQLARVDWLLEQSDSVKAFVQGGVVRDPLHKVTVKQLQQGYYTFCEQQGMQPMKVSDVNAQLPRFMLEIHQAIQRHDIMTVDGTKRGYKGVRLRTEVIHED